MPDSQIRAVIFDMDGTLLNTLPDIAFAVNTVLERHGFTGPPEDAFRKIVGSGMRNTVRMAIEAGGNGSGLPERGRKSARAEGPAASGSDGASAELIELLTAEVNNLYASEPAGRTRFYDGVEKLLDAVAERGVRMAVLSNKPDVLVRAIAREVLGKWEFSGIAGQIDGIPTKPDPATSLEMAARMHASPAEVLFLGDSDIDINTALSAGMCAVGAAWGFRGADELWNAGAHSVAEHPLDVLGIIDGGTGD